MEFKNDIGKPWRYEEDGYTVTRTSIWSPPGCHPVGCSLKLYVDENGKVARVEGDENNPITKGRLCVRCLALKDWLYNPSRAVYPMKRDPEFRGNPDKWERITWDEAFAIIKEKHEYYSETYGPWTQIVFSGTGRSGGIMVADMAQAVLGSPNACCPLSGFCCYQPRSVATTSVMGSYYPEMDYAGGLEGTYDNPEWKCPEAVMLWGYQPLASNAAGFYGHALIDIMKRGAKLIDIDPRVHWLATRAEVHVRLRPNTDAALAMAMINIIISEDLYDHEFVDYWCYGFDELKDAVKEMTPEKAAEICEVPVEDIYAAARLYATSKPAAISMGLALDQNQNCNQANQCLAILMCITGNVEVPGGNIIVASAPAVVKEYSHDDDEDEKRPTRRMGWDSLSKECQRHCLGIDEYPLFVDNIKMCHAEVSLKALLTDEPYKLYFGWIQSTNFLGSTCSQEPQKWYEAVKRLEFVMATDCFITPTIQACADLYLPLASGAERDDVNFVHYGGSPITIGAGNKATEPFGEAKSEVDLLIELGTYLGSEAIVGQWENERDELTKTRAAMSGMTFDELSKKVVHQRGNTYYKYETGLLRPDRKPGFLTATGRCELWTTRYANYGESPLPFYQEPAFSHNHPEHPEWKEQYPFILCTGARHIAFFHSENRQIPVLRELKPNPLCEIHPDDAAKYGITDGQWVELSNMFGKAVFKAKVTPTTKRGMLEADHGWWFPEDDGEAPNLFGTFRSNVNNLLPNNYNSKLGYGAPLKHCICAIKPLAVSYDTDMNEVWEKFGKLV